MPNWVFNILRVKGSPREIKRFDDAFKGKPPQWPLQGFEKYGLTNEEVAEKIMKEKREYEALEKDYCFNALFPVPDHILEVGFDGGNFRRELSFQEVVEASRNPSKSFDGYSWCNANWGTKWDVYGGVKAEIGEDVATYTFDTAWSPPIGVFLYASRGFQLEFEILFKEELIESAGRLRILNGLLLEEEFYDPCEDKEAMIKFVEENIDEDFRGLLEEIEAEIEQE